MKKSKGKETYEKNWTESDIGNFLYYVGADFVDQLQASFDTLGITQRSFAQKLNVSEGRISQVFNDPGNLTLDTMIKWGRAAGLKTGVILYNDGDVKNVRGPLSGSIFIECWKRLGSPIEMPNTQSNFQGSFRSQYDNPRQNTPDDKAVCEMQTALVRTCSGGQATLVKRFLSKQYCNEPQSEEFYTVQ